MKNLILSLTFISSILLSCNNKKVNEIVTSDNSIKISGAISGAENQIITLEQIEDTGKKEIKSATIGSNGEFVLNAKINELSIFQLRLGLGERKIIPLTLVPNDKVEIKCSFEEFETKPIISGTEWAKPLTNYMEMFNHFALKQVELMQKTELTQDEQIKQFFNIRKPIDDFAYNFINKDPSNPVNLILSTSLTPAMGFAYWDKKYLESFEKMSNAFQIKFKNTKISNSLSQQTAQLKVAYNDYVMTNNGEKDAPEIALKNPDGVEIKLSSLKGKVVLIDFWASWCAPCRRENPNVVKLYQKYKNKGFEIFSVSLDKDLESWKQAIKQDGLVWKYHVSDLMQWNTPLTQIYQFNSIPFTVLVNKNGKIIGTNLRGEILEQKLKEIL